MAVPAKRKIPSYRAPRYTLRAHDAKGMRFSNKRKGAQIFDTEIVNISETGMAFKVDLLNAPQIEEVIKLEFRVPADSHKIAWFGTVVWLESSYHVALRKKERIRVGIQFHDLPKRHLQILKHGLSSRFRELAHEVRRRKIISFIESLPEALMYVALIGLAVGGIYYLSQRLPDQSAERSNAWGEKFFKNVIREK